VSKDIIRYFIGHWNGNLLDAKLDVEDLDKLVGVAKRAFNYATKEKRKTFLRVAANKMSLIKRALDIDTPGAEFFIWNEANPLVQSSNSGDPWYKEFYELHTSVDAFTKSATIMLTKVVCCSNNAKF
jgi:hypothetical protein